MPSSSLFTVLKLSKTTSPMKLFDYDHVTLYYFRGEWETGEEIGGPGPGEE